MAVSAEAPYIVLVAERIDPRALSELVRRHFEDMVKYVVGRGRDECIEYTSPINVRPSAGNRSMVVEDEAVKARIRDLTHALIGRGEPLP